MCEIMESFRKGAYVLWKIVGHEVSRKRLLSNIYTVTDGAVKTGPSDQIRSVDRFGLGEALLMTWMSAPDGIVM